MNALDKLLAQALTAVIKKKLGEKTYEKIEIRLRERYKITPADAVRDFQKLDATLREFFGPGADAMEKDFLEHIISLDTSKTDRPWVIIENQELAQLILESYGDREKKQILDVAFRKPDVILDILERCNIPKSTGYRIINELVDDGLLTESGYATTDDGKRVNLYTSLFENVKIEIMQGKISVRVQLKEEVLHESFLVRILREVGQ
jgi:predicted transcriptional regulator